jgi:hypothetical protein
MGIGVELMSHTILSDRQPSNQKVSVALLGGATLTDIILIIATATHETSTSELRRMLAAAGVSMGAFQRQNNKESDYRLRARPIKRGGKVEWYWSIGWLRPKDPRLLIPPRCSIKGCERQHYAKQMCRRHYERQRYVPLPTMRDSVTNYAGPGLK